MDELCSDSRDILLYFPGIKAEVECATSITEIHRSWPTRRLKMYILLAFVNTIDTDTPFAWNL